MATRKGFTMVELLVVIAIMAILSGIIFAFVNSGNLRSRGMTCMGNLRAISNALKMYMLDEGGAPPFDPTIDVNDPLAGGLGLWALFASDATTPMAGGENRMGYLRSKNFLHCPEDSDHTNPYDPQDWTTYQRQDIYTGEWKYLPVVPGMPVSGEDPNRTRELACPLAPDNTVVTWCELHHKAYDSMAGPKDVVLFIDGSVRLLLAPDPTAGEDHRINQPASWGSELTGYVPAP